MARVSVSSLVQTVRERAVASPARRDWLASRCSRDALASVIEGWAELAGIWVEPEPVTALVISRTRPRTDE